MSKVIERAIECHFQSQAKPEGLSLELPRAESQYGWLGVTDAVVLPENATEEFCEICIRDCAALTLHAHLLQMLPCCTSLEEEMRIALRVVQWCTQMKPK